MPDSKSSTHRGWLLVPVTATYCGWLFLWIAALSLLAVDPRIAIVHLVGEHQFAHDSLPELVPRGYFALTLALYLLTFVNAKVRSYLPVANAGVVLMVTWLAVAPPDIVSETARAPFAVGLFVSVGVFGAYRAHRWTRNLLRTEMQAARAEPA